MTHYEPLEVERVTQSEESGPERMLRLMRSTLRSQRMREVMRDQNTPHSQPAKKVACG